MVSSPVFKVLMFIWSLPIASTFFISRSAASTSHDVISGTSFGSVWIMVHCSYSSMYNFSIRSMILSWSWISLPCLSRGVISLSWPSFCVLRIFFRLFDANDHFWYDILVVFPDVHSCLLSWWSCIFLRTLFVVYCCRFPAFLFVTSSIRAHVGDGILDLCGLLIALATLDRLCCIISAMASLVGSMSSSSCALESVSQFELEFNIIWSYSCGFYPHSLLVINVFLSTSTSTLMLVITSLWLLPMLSWLMTVRSVTMSALFVRMYQFRSSLHRLGFSTSISSLLSSGTWYSWFCTFLMLPILPRCQFSPNLPVTVSI